MVSENIETAVAYEDRDNSIKLTLKKNGVTLTSGEMTAITKYEIKYKDVYYDSDAYPDAFVPNNAEGTLEIKPYELGLVTGSDKVELIVYDSTNYTHGLVWEQFKLKVKSDAIVE